MQYRAFLCYSWLLYPPMVARLPELSNIRRFAGLFTVIGTCGDPEQAVENIQDKTTTIGRLASKKLLGFACGVIPIEF